MLKHLVELLILCQGICSAPLEPDSAFKQSLSFNISQRTAIKHLKRIITKHLTLVFWTEAEWLS